MPSAARLRVLAPAPGATMVGELKAAVTPGGNPEIERATGALNPLINLLTVIETELAACPAWIENAGMLLASVKFGAGVTVTATGRDRIKPPPEATTVTVYLPGGVLIAASKLSVLTPAPGAANVGGENELVMPVGNPVTDSDVAALNVPMLLRVTAIVDGVACTTETELFATAMPRSGGTMIANGRLMV